MNVRISARIASFVVMGSTLLAASSCLRETPGYCAYAGGNSACEATYDGTFCIFQGPDFVEEAEIEYRNVNEAQRLGCYESLPMMLYGPDEVMDFYGCVPAGLTDEKGDLFDDLLALRKKTGYDLADFLGEHGGIPGVSLAECRSDSDTSSDTSDSSTGTTGMETSTTVGESSESSTTGPMLCTGNKDCTESEAPQCVDGVCRACIEAGGGDAACDEFDETRPLCAGGTCVQCTPAHTVACDVQQLACDGVAGSCVPCTEHAQCSSEACELDPAVRRCFPGDFVVHVDGDVGAKADYTNIQSAVNAVGNGHGVIMVHELNGVADYESTLISGGKVALLAAPGESPSIEGTSSSGIRATGAGTVLYVDGITIANNENAGISGLGLRVFDDAFVWVDRSRIVQNAGGGIRVDGGAELTLRNSFLGRNGDDLADTRGITAIGASLSVSYTTIALNYGTGATGPISMSCDDASSGWVRNSIVAAGNDTITCTNVSFNFNVVDTPGLSGTHNNVLSFTLAWFPNIAASDFHIAAGPPFADVAKWQSGDPITDIDGAPRPTMDGTADYAGADLP